MAFNAEAAKRVATLYAPETVTCLAITPDGSCLVVGAGAKLVVHSVPSTLPMGVDLPRIASLDLPGTVSSVVISPDGTVVYAAVGDKVHVLAISQS
jgi:hypothetical protein